MMARKDSSMSDNAIQEREEKPAAIKTPQELVHIRHKISLRQYKYWILMLRAYRKTYESGGIGKANEFHQLSMVEIEAWLGYEPVKTELKADLEALRREPIFYNILTKDKKTALRGAGFISEWEITSNWIAFKLPGFLQECVEQLDLKGAMFQALNWSVFNSFTGKYEAVLYKLCKDYEGAVKMPEMTIASFREYMGLKETEYEAFKDLNKFVISGPMSRINASELSDIVISVDFERENRRVVKLRFKVELKKQTMLDFGDDPAFRFAKVDISIGQQQTYLKERPPELIELAIQRANEYAEEQGRQGRDVNLGALYRKAIDEDWGKEYQSKKVREAEKKALEQAEKDRERTQEATKAEDDLRDRYSRQETVVAVKALSLEDRKRFATVYQEEKGEGSLSTWQAETGTLKSPVERAKFDTWLRAKLTKPFDESRFLAWCASQGRALKSKQATTPHRPNLPISDAADSAVEVM
jgi:Initiator Replication protein